MRKRGASWVNRPSGDKPLARHSLPRRKADIRPARMAHAALKPFGSESPFGRQAPARLSLPTRKANLRATWTV
jgi:hypothetical protein